MSKLPLDAARILSNDATAIDRLAETADALLDQSRRQPLSSSSPSVRLSAPATDLEPEVRHPDGAQSGLPAVPWQRQGSW